MRAKKNIAIIGTGLIGGSLAIRLHEMKLSSKLIGVESNSDNAKIALEKELVDQILPLDEAIAIADVIILAIPMDGMLSLLPSLLDKVSHQIVMDMGSTKQQVIELVQSHPNRKRYVATHPMWGTEFSGPAAAVRDAFENRAVIICDADQSDADALAWVKGMYEKIGMRLLFMTGADHDLHAAYVSHISHITSFALANTVLQKEKEESAIFNMASAGFASTVRLAKSNAAMWVPIFLQNKDKILDVLDEHIGQLVKFRDNIEHQKEEELKALIADANKISRILQ
jgi:prephenate dehydrogenase